MGSYCRSIAAATVIGALGCGQLLDVDAYEIQEDASLAPSIPILPATPDSARVDACRACAEELCQPEREECAGSPQCRALLSCQTKCNDPNCIFKCRDTNWKSQIFDDYVECVFGGSIIATGVPDDRRGQCKDPCGTGENWECKEGFRWDAIPRQGTITVDVRIIDAAIATAFSAPGPLAGLTGIQIAACGQGLSDATRGDAGCDVFEDADGYGMGSIEVDPRGHTSIGVKSTYGDFRAFVRPLVRDASVEISIPQRNMNWSVVESAALAAGTAIDPETGLLEVYQWDCLVMPASASYSLETSGVPFCWQPGGTSPDFTLHEGPNCAFVNVPPAIQLEVSSFGSDGAQLSRRTVRIDTGWFTEAALYPIDETGL